MKKSFLLIAFLFVLCGCAKQSAGIEQPAGPSETAPQSSDVPSAPEESEPEETLPEEPKIIVAPTADEVYAAREQALDGMTEDQIESLTSFIKRANLWLEAKYLHGTFFSQLEKPDNLEWNYFHETGEIQIGWAYDGSLDKELICEEERLTENEFYEKYATGVVTTNTYDADGFTAKIDSFKADVQNEALIIDLQYIIDESLLARDTHDVEHVWNLYRILHDMDYFLLRYGPEDVGPYVRDASTVSKYYGTLSIYENSQDQ